MIWQHCSAHKNLQRQAAEMTENKSYIAVFTIYTKACIVVYSTGFPIIMLYCETFCVWLLASMVLIWQAIVVH